VERTRLIGRIDTDIGKSDGYADGDEFLGGEGSVPGAVPDETVGLHVVQLDEERLHVDGDVTSASIGCHNDTSISSESWKREETGEEETRRKRGTGGGRKRTSKGKIGWEGEVCGDSVEEDVVGRVGRSLRHAKGLTAVEGEGRDLGTRKRERGEGSAFHDWEAG
jgi:hypothetical protein